jgi:hypothetical protein
MADADRFRFARVDEGSSLAARHLATERTSLGPRVTYRAAIGGCRRGPLGMLPAWVS